MSRVIGSPRVMYCRTCGTYRSDRCDGQFACPVCGTVAYSCRCYRCGHTWTPRDPAGRPQGCPRCKSPYWNRLRQRDRRGGADGRRREGTGPREEMEEDER